MRDAAIDIDPARQLQQKLIFALPPLIAGYASVIPLSALEARLLVGLMRARQSALILVNYWRAHLFPDEARYIKKNVARAEHGLSILAPLGVAAGEAAVLAARSSSVL